MAVKDFKISDMDFGKSIPVDQQEIKANVKDGGEEKPYIVPEGQHGVVVLCIDKSGSMSADDSSSGISRMELVNQHTRDLINTNIIKGVDKETMDMCIISFDSNVNIEKDFAPMSMIDDDIDMQASGMTSLYSALIVAVQAARRRRNQMINDGIECFKPVIFLLTDGAPTDTKMKATCRKVLEKYVDKNSDGKAKMNLVVCGMDQCDMSAMAELSPDAKIIGLANTDAINDVFEMIKHSLAAISQSDVSDEIRLAFDSLNGLGVIKGQSRSLNLN